MICRLTIVDDEALAEFYSDVAESAGTGVARYPNGTDFIHSDLDGKQTLLLDLMMPQIDNIHVCDSHLSFQSLQL